MAEKAADDDSSNSSCDDDDDDDEEVITEFRFVPSDKVALESMFSAMCECQALHPDPEDDDSDNDFEGEEYDVEEAEAEHGHADIPPLHLHEGLSALTQRPGHAGRLGMLAQSVAHIPHAGVRTEEANADWKTAWRWMQQRWRPVSSRTRTLSTEGSHLSSQCCIMGLGGEDSSTYSSSYLLVIVSLVF
ncbi:methylosome subunit pICln [Etheostoma spectabile]|uniref:methylosome subunit pICln n=1 Tax=Etheostoma spectabile TaxID=54343 RepID=UPI0013AF87FD|nr:methylosome subunit pICln [Etheostoma spectabile]